MTELTKVTREYFFFDVKQERNDNNNEPSLSICRSPSPSCATTLRPLEIIVIDRERNTAGSACCRSDFFYRRFIDTADRDGIVWGENEA